MQINQLPRQVIFSYFTMGISFLINPILILLLTRNLSLAEYGAYALLAITVNVGGVILELGFSQYIIAKLSGNNKQKKTFTSILIFFALLLFTATIIIQTSPIQKFILDFLQLQNNAIEFKLGCYIIIASTLTRIILAYISAQRKLITVNILTILTATLQLLMIITAIKFIKLDLLVVMETWLISAIVTFVISFIITIRDLTLTTLRQTTKIIREGIIFSMPLLAVVSSSWIIEIGDRYIINMYIGKEAVALYTLAYSLMTVAASLGTIISQTFFPYYATAWNKKQPTEIFLNASIKYTLLIVLPATTGLIMLSEEIITLISGPAYLAASPVIPALIVYPLLSAMSYIIYQILLLLNKTKTIAVTYIFGALINIILNIFLIPKYGIVGAALATIFSYLSVFLILTKQAKNFISLDLKFLRIERIILATIIFGFVLSNLNPVHYTAKIATIIFGAAFFGILVILLKVLTPQEKQLLLRTLPGNLKPSKSEK
jgi:O-antigen/teichoic acid export membrane protein